MIWIYRKHAIIRASSPFFLTVVLFGGLIGLGAMTAFWGFPTDASCNLQFWFSSIAFTVAFGSLFLKSYRVWRIFSSEYKAVYMKDSQLFVFLSVLLLINSIVCAVWSGYGDPSPHLRFEPGASNPHIAGITPQHYFCDSKSEKVFFWLLIGLNSLLVIAGCILAYKTRHISEVFSESSYVALSIYTFLIVGIFIIPVLQLLNDNIAAEILRNGAYICWVAAPVLLVTAPKFWRLNEDVDLADELSKGTTKTIKTTPSSGAKSTALQNTFASDNGNSF